MTVVDSLGDVDVSVSRQNEATADNSINGELNLVYTSIVNDM